MTATTCSRQSRTTANRSVRPARFVAIEGATGTGKSTLVRRLSSWIHAEPVFDPFEQNPFLDRLYRQQRVRRTSDLAIPTELTFIGLRIAQLREVACILQQGQLVLADWALFKQAVFASLTLATDDAERVAATCAVWSGTVPQPDLVVHLRASERTLARRITDRGRSMENGITRTDLTRLINAYDTAITGLTCQVMTVDTDTFDVFADHQVMALAHQVLQRLDISEWSAP